MRPWKLSLLLSLSLVIGGYAERNAVEEKNPYSTEWSQLYEGIDFRRASSEEKRLQKVCVLRIDTQQEELCFYTTGRHKNFKDTDSETERETASDFLTEHQLLAAVNANFYSPFNSHTRTTRGPSNVIGLAVSEGELVSKAQEEYPSFTVSSNKVCKIGIIKPGDSLEGIRTAVAGNAIVLKNGEITHQESDDVHPRTAIGISQDGRYVYLMTIDGRQPGFSMGASLEEVGKWLKNFGAWEGLNLDGGGSTTMVVRGENGKAKVMNVPIGNANIPGYLRHNANHIGVRKLSEEK